MKDVKIGLDPLDRPRFDRLMDYLEAKQNAGVQAKLDEAAASLKQSNNTLQTDLQEK